MRLQQVKIECSRGAMEKVPEDDDDLEAICCSEVDGVEVYQDPGFER